MTWGFHSGKPPSWLSQTTGTGASRYTGGAAGSLTAGLTSRSNALRFLLKFIQVRNQHSSVRHMFMHFTCVFRTNPAKHSGPEPPAIPIQSCHSFRSTGCH